MTLGIAREGLAEPLREFTGAGRPTLGTCAGLIMLDRAHLDVMDIVAERNAFGRQVKSFESDIDLARWETASRRVHPGALGPEHGPGSRYSPRWTVTRAVAAGNILAVAFHPEIEGETRLHEWLLEQVTNYESEGRQ